MRLVCCEALLRPESPSPPPPDDSRAMSPKPAVPSLVLLPASPTTLSSLTRLLRTTLDSRLNIHNVEYTSADMSPAPSPPSPEPSRMAAKRSFLLPLSQVLPWSFRPEQFGSFAPIENRHSNQPLSKLTMNTAFIKRPSLRLSLATGAADAGEWTGTSSLRDIDGRTL